MVSIFKKKIEDMGTMIVSEVKIAVSFVVVFLKGKNSSTASTNSG